MKSTSIAFAALLFLTAFSGCATEGGGIKDRLCTAAPVACREYKVIKESVKTVVSAAKGESDDSSQD